MKTTVEDGKLYCSFCAKSQDKTHSIIAGPAAFICDQCVGWCADILAEEEAKKVLQADFDKKLEAIRAANDRMMGDKQEARLNTLRMCAVAVDEIRLPWFSVGSRWLKRTISRTFREMADRWEREPRP